MVKNPSANAGDDIIVSVPPYTPSENEELEERVITKKDAWCNKTIGELELGADELIAMILRDGASIIPDGKTVLREADVVVLYR